MTPGVETASCPTSKHELRAGTIIDVVLVFGITDLDVSCELDEHDGEAISVLLIIKLRGNCLMFSTCQPPLVLLNVLEGHAKGTELC